MHGAPMWGTGDDLPLALHVCEDALPRQGTPDVQVRFGSYLAPDMAAQLMPWCSSPPGVAPKVPVAVPLPVMPQGRASAA